MIPRTIIDEQIEEDAATRRLILGSDPLDFSHVEPLQALPADSPGSTELLVLRTCEMPRDGMAIPFTAGVRIEVRHYGTALINRWILSYGMRVQKYPLPTPAPKAPDALPGVPDSPAPIDPSRPAAVAPVPLFSRQPKAKAPRKRAAPKVKAPRKSARAAGAR